MIKAVNERWRECRHTGNIQQYNWIIYMYKEAEMKKKKKCIYISLLNNLGFIMPEGDQNNKTCVD